MPTLEDDPRVRAGSELRADVSSAVSSRRVSVLSAPHPVVLAFILFAGTLVVYLPALNNRFVNYDDPAYVTANAHVLRGLSWANVKWALTATVEANWHPLTWISHMGDVQVFGSNPRGHHFMSVLLHGLNVILFFFVLLRATGSAARSALVAALFAVHPLNVECVAWVAERKSLLSMLLLLLALGAYGWYAARRSFARYALVLMSFALGLAAKPMIVTFPVLLLLWDYWPLGRARNSKVAAGKPAWWLLAEKIPFFVLAAASAWITLYAQRRGGALGSTTMLPLSQRLENAVYSYAAYIGNGLWPARLAVFYPHPEGTLAAWKCLLAAVLIAGITALVWRYRKERRYLRTGWLWYLVAMLPMIGIVQVGRQAMADRYAYLPFLGLFVIAVWGGAELFQRMDVSPVVRGVIVATSLAAYGSVTFLQIHYWSNSYALFSHALAVTERNGVAEDNLGVALMELGKPDAAARHFEAAEEFMPQLSTPHYNLGVWQQQQNHLENARREYELALKYSSDPTEIAQTHNNLGFILLGANDLNGAKNEFTAALNVNPEKQNSLLGRGMVEYREKDLDGAVGDFTRAVNAAPLAAASFWLGRALEDRGQTEAAASAYEAALKLAPDMAEARQRLLAVRTGQ